MVPENWSNQCNHQLLAPDVVPLGSDTEEQTSFQIGFLGGPMTVDRRPLFALQLIGPLPTALTFPLWPSASPSSLAGARPWQRQAHTSKIEGEFPGTPWAASGNGAQNTLLTGCSWSGSRSWSGSLHQPHGCSKVSAQGWPTAMASLIGLGSCLSQLLSKKSWRGSYLEKIYLIEIPTEKQIPHELMS